MKGSANECLECTDASNDASPSLAEVGVKAFVRYTADYFFYSTGKR